MTPSAKTAGSPPPANRHLYTAGRRYVACKTSTQSTYTQVAEQFSVHSADVSTAVKFFHAVDAIAANLGSAAKNLLLSEHPSLPAETVMKISRTHRDRQRFTLANVRKGRSPFAKPPAGTDPPFDTHDLTEVRSRLRRNAGLLDHVADGLLSLPLEGWPGRAALRCIRSRLVETVRDCTHMAGLLAAAGGKRLTVPGSPPWAPSPSPRPFDPSSVKGFVAAVRGVTAKNLRDLPRVLREAETTKEELIDTRVGVARLRAAAERLMAVVDAQRHDHARSPAAVPGTYVTVYRLPKAVKGLRVGALGTFDFPAGYYAYVGSAFGGGGVGKRTGRHLTPGGKKRWNVDYFKGYAKPVEVWWTYARQRVECHWAGLVGELAGACCHADQMGARDCKTCPTHFWHFDKLPLYTDFVASVTERLPGHAPVYRAAVVRDWDGHGWPGRR